MKGLNRTGIYCNIKEDIPEIEKIIEEEQKNIKIKL